MLSDKIDVMSKKLEPLYVNFINSSTPSLSYEISRSVHYLAVNCYVGSPFTPTISESVNYVTILILDQPMTHHQTLMILVGGITPYLCLTRILDYPQDFKDLLIFNENLKKNYDREYAFGAAKTTCLY